MIGILPPNTKPLHCPPPTPAPLPHTPPPLSPPHTQVKPCLMVNKLDRLITELRLSPAEAASRLNAIVAHANMIWSAFDSEHFMREADAVLAAEQQQQQQREGGGGDADAR